MSYGLKDLFVGVIYVFVIFLPGALLIGVFAVAFPGIRGIDLLQGMDPAASWLTFLGASFLFGHLVSFFGAEVEDRIPNDWKRRHDDSKDVSPGLRAAAEAIVRSHVPAAALGGHYRRWAAAILRQLDAPSYRDVERKDADRRFFRNVSIVFLAGAVLLAIVATTRECSEAEPELLAALLPSAGALALSVLSALRYRSQDGGFTRLVFECLILACRTDAAERSESWELRWFGEGDVPHAVEAAFRTPSTSGPEERTDHYARETGDATGLKLREGWLEVKSRVERVDGRFGPLEHWTKLRFRAGASESDAATRPDLWLAVNKRRRLRKFAPGEAGQLEEMDARARADSGCQVELTELVVDGRRAWTVGFEAFGPQAWQRALLEACATRVLPELSDAATARTTYAGYPEWLLSR